jgi:phage baseplate assembly protein V
MSDHVWRRLQLLFAQGAAKLIGHAKVQARVLSDEVLPNLDRVEPYGFSYRPKPGAEAYLLFPSGDRSYGVAIVIGDRQYNMTLEEGEVAIHDDAGNYVHLKRGGNIEVKANAEITLHAPRVVLDTPETEITGNVSIAGNTAIAQGLSVLGEGGAGSTITGEFAITGGISCNGKNIGDTHTHTGVIPGGGTTGEVQ